MGGMRERLIVGSMVAGLLAGAAWPALADTYGDGEHVGIGTNGSSARGFVAVSDSGTATGDCIPDGFCLVGPGVAVSGTNTANGAIGVSGTGTATGTGLGWGTPAVAVAGSGCATASEQYGADAVAVSLLGCSTGDTSEYWGGYGIAVSPLGPASGEDVAVSVRDNATHHGSCAMRTPWFWPGPSVTVPVGPAVSVTGNATSPGCQSVTVTGKATS